MANWWEGSSTVMTPGGDDSIQTITPTTQSFNLMEGLSPERAAAYQNLGRISGLTDFGYAGANTAKYNGQGGFYGVIGTGEGEYRPWDDITGGEEPIFGSRSGVDTNLVRGAQIADDRFIFSPNNPTHYAPQHDDYGIGSSFLDYGKFALSAYGLGNAVAGLNTFAGPAIAEAAGVPMMPPAQLPAGMMPAATLPAGLAGLAGGAATGTAGTSLNNSIYQPMLQSLVDAGVPFEVAQAIPSTVNSALQGGALSKLTGGDFTTGAGMGAIGSVIGNVANSFGYNLPTSVISLAARALSSGLGLFGNEAGTSTGPPTGTPTGPSGAAGQALGASLLGGQAPRSGMLSFAPTGPLSMAGRPSQAPALFAGIEGGVAPYQAPMQDVNLSNLPFDETLFAAKGGLMRLAEGGQLEKNIAALQKLLSPAEKSVSQGEQIKNYLTRKALADSKLDFVSPLQSRTVKGRAGKSQMFAGLPQEAIPDVPRMAATNYGISPLRESVDFIPRARIPFAAHGGQIHPMLSRVLKERGVEFVPGPEGRMYARHKERGFAVGGAGTGQSDDIPTMLSDGEYVIDADTVAALGDGSSKAGAAILDKFRESIRKHKRSAPLSEIPPKAKRPEQYLKGK